MKKLDEILQELGISKVKLAKYLGVSRQMIYNYLELESLNKWPKEKKMLLFKLLDIKDGSENSLNKIKINSDYILSVEKRLNETLSENASSSSVVNDIYDVKKLKKDEQELFSKIVYLIKEKFTDNNNHTKNMATLNYLFHTLQSIDNVDEIKFFLAYMSKINGITEPDDFKYNENNQYLFESILYSALTLYSSGMASKSKIAEYRKKFVDASKRSKEEKLSRTEKLTEIYVQALQELGYQDFNHDNQDEILAKLAEIESRNCT